MLALAFLMSQVIFLIFLLIFGGFVVLTLIARPPLLATFFALDGCGMVLLWTNKSEGGHCQPFLVLNICSKEQRMWGSPQIKIMSFDFVKK